MNTVWKPHTEKLKVRNQNPLSRMASLQRKASGQQTFVGPHGGLARKWNCEQDNRQRR